MRFSTSQSPRSAPERTSERGAGTRQAPCRQASHISSQDASKATDRPASTRSRVPSGLPCRNSRASASTNAAALRWLTATPFGFPVEPDVKMIHASSSRPGRRGPMRFGGVDASGDGALGADDGADAGLAEHHVGALLGVVGVDGDVGGADRQRREDRDVQVGGARRDADADPVAVADPGGAERGAEGVDLAQQRGVVEHAVAVVDAAARSRAAVARNVARGSLSAAGPATCSDGTPGRGHRAGGQLRRARVAVSKRVTSNGCGGAGRVRGAAGTCWSRRRPPGSPGGAGPGRSRVGRGRAGPLRRADPSGRGSAAGRCSAAGGASTTGSRAVAGSTGIALDGRGRATTGSPRSRLRSPGRGSHSGQDARRRVARCGGERGRAKTGPAQAEPAGRSGPGGQAGAERGGEGEPEWSRPGRGGAGRRDDGVRVVGPSTRGRSVDAGPRPSLRSQNRGDPRGGAVGRPTMVRPARLRGRAATGGPVGAALGRGPRTGAGPGNRRGKVAAPRTGLGSCPQKRIHDTLRATMREGLSRTTDGPARRAWARDEPRRGASTAPAIGPRQAAGVSGQVDVSGATTVRACRPVGGPGVHAHALPFAYRKPCRCGSARPRTAVRRSRRYRR